MMRAPADRLMSAYNFGRAHRRSFIDSRLEYSEKSGCYDLHGISYAAAKDQELCDYLRSEEPFLRNQMVRWIGGDEGSEAQMMARAKARLHQMAAIGFLDDMQVSLWAHLLSTRPRSASLDPAMRCVRRAAKHRGGIRGDREDCCQR